MRQMLRLLPLLVALLPGAALAQLSSLANAGHGPPVSRTAPVTFQADHVSYDRDTGIVTATGHVEAWQNGRVLRADRVTFNRNTDVAAASGNVAIVEPDGQVLFADYAELTQGMRDAALTGMRAILAQNGKLAANGARRIGGQVNELSRAVYSTCNVCALHPDSPPLWEIRAYDGTQDLQHHRIEYRDAYLDFLGVPVMYLPYFANADPGVKRQSGLLVPDVIAYDKHIGTGIAVPYYLVIDNTSDATITPLLATKEGPQLTVQYRKDFNNGIVRATGAVADDDGAQGYLFLHSLFNYDNTYRYGADINVASSVKYLNDFRIPGYGNTVLPSDAYVEGFGVGAYTRIDVTTYQAIATSVIQDELPFVLPRYLYDFEGQPDALGGRLSFTTEDWNIVRQVGANDQRLGIATEWNRPFFGPAGQQYNFTARLAGAAYNAYDLTAIPTYQTVGTASTVQALPTVAVKMNWPFVRFGGGTQTIEPIVQLIGAPQSGNSINDHIPNEDALAYEFNDTTLFSLNRYAGGYDRQDGGLRANVGLHGNWTWAGSQLDGLVGESFRNHIDQNMLPDTGLDGHASDIVARTTVSPAPWLDLVARGRFDPHNNLDVHYGEGVASVGNNTLRLNGGYIYSSTDPYYFYDSNYLTSATLPASFFVPRHEATAGFNANYGHYHLNGYATRDLQDGQLVVTGLDGRYDDECFTFDINFNRRYTSIDNDGGDTSIIFTLTFKTVGSVGFNAS